jgi:hypothetical protein
MNVPKKIIITRIILLCACLFLIYYVLEYQEPYKRNIIGDQLVNTHTTLFPRISLVIPIRKHVKYWPALVPLTPFKTSLLIVPYEGILPNFLLYKPDKLSPIQNQADCGSCFAFSACSVLADRMAIKSRGVFNQNLSVQQLLSCSNRGGCDGGSPEEALLWISQTGTLLGTEQAFPYVQGSGGWVNTPCPKKLKGIKVGVRPQSVHSIVEFIPEDGYDTDILAQNIKNMKAELMTGGPFYCALTVYDDLFTFTGSEVYVKQKGSSLVGGHAIEIIGYCERGVDKRKGWEKPYWVCRNSWAENWPTNSPEAGYFAVEMGTNMCGIESRCGFGEPELFTPVQLAPSDLPLTDFIYTDIRDYVV